MSWLALSASFEYLCYGSTAIIILYTFSAGIVFRGPNLTSTDVRFWSLKSVPAPKGLRLFHQIMHCLLTPNSPRGRHIVHTVRETLRPSSWLSCSKYCVQSGYCHQVKYSLCYLYQPFNPWALKYVCINHGDQRCLLIWKHHKCLS